MDQFTIKLAWDYTFMKQLCSKHETTMQEGLKVIKVQALIHLKTAPKVLKMMGKLSCQHASQ